MKKLIYSLAFLFAGILTATAALPTVTIGTVSNPVQGQVYTVPVTVSGCDASNSGTGITGFEMHFSYTNAIQYYGTINLYSGFSIGDVNFNGNGTQFVGLWSSPTLLPYNIPDGTVLFEVQFIAKVGGVSPLNFLQIGNQTILLDQNFDVIPGSAWSNGSITVPAPAATSTWNSASAQSWSTIANWSNGLPGSITNAVVGTGILLADNSNTALCNNLTVNAGAALTINSGVTLSVPGDFILESNSSNIRTGSLINNGTLNVAGLRTVKRWLQGGMNHFISTPLRNGTKVSTLYVSGNPGWAYRYNEPTHAWVNMVQLTDPITVSNGYCVNYLFERLLTFSISDNPGFNVSPTYNPNTYRTGTTDGWNLVGNPFLAALDWKASGYTKTGIDPTVYFFNGTTYASFNGTTNVSTNGGTQCIPAMQAFFIHASATPNFIMPKTALVHNAQPYYKSNVSDLLRLSINGNSYSDETVVMFNSASSEDFDTEMDAYKLISLNETVPQVYTTSSDVEYSINSLPELSNEVKITLAVKIGAQGNYSINATDLDNFATDVAIHLEDTETNSVVNLRNNPVYSFEAGVGTSNRFRLILGKTTGLGENSLNNSLVFSSGKNIFIENASGIAEVYNLTGQKVSGIRLIENSMNTINMNNAAEGVYLVKILTDGSTNVTKVLVK